MCSIPFFENWQLTWPFDSVNDLFSAKKEISVGSIDSLIPLAYAAGTPLQSAVDQAVRDIQHCIDRFDKAALAITEKGFEHLVPAKPRTRYRLRSPSLASRLGGKTQKFQSKKSSHQQWTFEEFATIASFIETSRQNCTGNLAWR